MKYSKWSLIFGIVSTLVFIGLLMESEPLSYRGLQIDIRVARMVCLLIAVINFASYLNLKKWD